MDSAIFDYLLYYSTFHPSNGRIHHDSLCECLVLGSQASDEEGDLWYNKAKNAKDAAVPMYIDPMTKMNISLIAIGLMFVCNLVMIFARKITNGFLRFLVKAFAFLLLLVVLVMILIVIFV
ncbi:DUF2768 domain-containing protein [Brevibacillus brevis]|uniref:DUF2768 domain-containing protein n=3 Tax=Brevibacillus TaxID=55080 RepID=UPI003641398F